MTVYKAQALDSIAMFPLYSIACYSHVQHWRSMWGQQVVFNLLQQRVQVTQWILVTVLWQTLLGFFPLPFPHKQRTVRRRLHTACSAWGAGSRRQLIAYHSFSWRLHPEARRGRGLHSSVPSHTNSPCISSALLSTQPSLLTSGHTPSICRWVICTPQLLTLIHYM